MRNSSNRLGFISDLAILTGPAISMVFFKSLRFYKRFCNFYDFRSIYEICSNRLGFISDLATSMLSFDSCHLVKSLRFYKRFSDFYDFK